MNLLKEFWHDESGQDLVEYLLMVGFVAFAAIAIMESLAPTLQRFFTSTLTHSKAISANIATTADIDSFMIRVTCGVLAIVFISAIVMRRKKDVDKH